MKRLAWLFLPSALLGCGDDRDVETQPLVDACPPFDGGPSGPDDTSTQDGSGTPDARSTSEGGDTSDASSGGPTLECVWTSEEFSGCNFVSPLRYDSVAGPRVVTASGDGRVVALDPGTGATVWNIDLPEETGEFALVIATPVIVADNRLVIAWQDVAGDAGDPATFTRVSHRVGVIDLEQGVLDAAFPVIELSAQKPDADGTGTVTFLPTNALSRSELAYAMPTGSGRGLVYVSFGNARDLQPWHGWIFELDLDAWHDSGSAAAVSSVLLTTPESQCGTPGTSGSMDMICGAGVWAPAGPQVVPTVDGNFELFIPTGNGALDLSRSDYAHTVMRVVGAGLTFDDGCDDALCADFDVLAPSVPCMESCRNLFIPRLRPMDPFFDVPLCEGLTFFECYARLDWDLGANAPAVVDVPGGPRVLVLPAKDGGVYLIDYENLGTLHDRLQILSPCGSNGGTCTTDWAGMMVTQPEITMVEGTPLAVISTFVFDDVNPAGLVGVRIVMRDGAPRLEKAWEAPRFDTPLAVEAFRRHSSRVRLLDFDGVTYATVVDRATPTTSGTLYLVRVSDGAIVQRASLEGPGQRFAQPLVIDEHIFVPSCVDGNRGPGHVEAFRLARGAVE